MILLIDNYDSFTYNLAHLFGALGCEVKVVRNDAIDPDAAADLAPSQLVISPGPGRPGEAGATIEIVRRLAPRGKGASCAGRPDPNPASAFECSRVSDPECSYDIRPGERAHQRGGSDRRSRTAARIPIAD